MNTIRNGEVLKADVDGMGTMTDFDLTEHYEDVVLFDKIKEQHDELTYNELQLNLFANANGFIGISGGSTLLLNLFQKPTITYLYNSSDLRDKFWEDENGNINIKNYYYMMNPKTIPFIDKDCSEMRNQNNDRFLNKIKETFNETN